MLIKGIEVIPTAESPIFFDFFPFSRPIFVLIFLRYARIKKNAYLEQIHFSEVFENCVIYYWFTFKPSFILYVDMGLHNKLTQILKILTYLSSIWEVWLIINTRTHSHSFLLISMNLPVPFTVSEVKMEEGEEWLKLAITYCILYHVSYIFTLNLCTLLIIFGRLILFCFFVFSCFILSMRRGKSSRLKCSYVTLLSVLSSYFSL